ncbi:hypothetical protein EV175_007263, partial [Coemansia sp. RSA 1933]
PRGRLHSSSTKRKDKKQNGTSSKKREHGNNGGGSDTKSTKKTRVADAHVPSTSGVTVKAADEAVDGSNVQNNPDKEGRVSEPKAVITGGASNGDKNKDQSAVPASIPAPVPTAAKVGGIKLKLLG